MTVDALITDAFREIDLPKAAKDLTYQDRAFALRKLNAILDTYNAQPSMTLWEFHGNYSLVAGTITYNIGPDAVTPNIQAARPVQIDRAVVFVDSPGSNNIRRELLVLDPIAGRDWIVDHYSGQKGIPEAVIYTPSYPQANLAFLPNPDKAYSFEISYRAQFPQFTTLNDAFVFPPAFLRLLTNQLAIEMSSAYQVQPSAMTLEAYKDSLYAIKKLNQRQSVGKPDPRAPGTRRYFDINTGWYR